MYLKYFYYDAEYSATVFHCIDSQNKVACYDYWFWPWIACLV